MASKPELESTWIGKENPPSLRSYGGQAGRGDTAGI
jgi:hypothetical protein